MMKLRKQLNPCGRIVVWIAGETGLLNGIGKYSTEENA
jgi:hypothetical protein